ncbi:MAG: AAA family ATPase [Mycoplasmataceae bacterium]|jgi:DNA helicase-2/ATP-dependent DNA helicase PcrA|nr:AAA family ATPase [Mycoplasmataceae bacterium]
MDKRIILAVAGSGKTTYLVNQIPQEERSLVLTYTESNKLNLQKKIIDRFDNFPKSIRIQTYFSFLYSFCIQPFLKHESKLNGLIYKTNPNKFAKGDKRYLTRNNHLYYNRAAKFVGEMGLHKDIQKRLEKYYQHLYIDEIQDFAGYDFELLENISRANVNILYVGDFFQHTFDTSRDGTVKQSLHDDYNKYKEIFIKLNFIVDEKTLVKSYRCSPQICSYIRNNLNINIESHGEHKAEIKYIDNKMDIECIMNNDDIIKLFYKMHYQYRCNSRNWGDCKGTDEYNDVCVVLNNKTLDFYFKDKLKELSNITLNKLYVAISRAHRNVYFISEKDIKNYLIEKTPSKT